MLHLFLAEHKDGGCQKNGKATSRGSASLDGASEGRLLLPVKSADTERGVSNINQTVHSSTKPGHGGTPVTSKNQKFKSVAKSTSTLDLPSLPGPSFVEDNGSLQGLNSTATKRFSANRVKLQQPKSEQKSREHPETRKVDFGNSPKSQWESLEQISPLQIHRTLDLANKTKKGVLNTTLDTGVSPKLGLNLSWAPPPGVSTICVHFLQDNRKGQPFRQPKPCLNCTKHSKLMYGIWRSDTKEWQVMRPYPKDVNPNVPFQLCRHFSNGDKCQKCPCTFAHGREELSFWTSERQSGTL